MVGALTFIVLNVLWDHQTLFGIEIPRGLFPLYENGEFVRYSLEFWYIGSAFAFLCYRYVIRVKLRSIWTRTMVVIVGTQLTDELLMMATVPNLYEYIVPLACFLYWKGWFDFILNPVKKWYYKAIYFLFKNKIDGSNY